ncbi:RICIN domain-containing protein [Luteolibacter luteus]|uniref:RICIN domain-containing protein n=1 Tax=Luteolibacter luteus TaxID=2728835 RepID=A0A858RGU5_9BACT|nr:RICIN domain-containing protein [Luteolibacter luteus]QJE95801.1 RICIN domain-containing protein [Luteolibacter luteus]
MKPKNPKQSTRPPRTRRALLATAALLGASGTGLYWHQAANTVSPEVVGQTQHPKALDRARNLPDPEQRRMEKLAKLGENAVPTGMEDPQGPPVAALIPERELIGSGWKSDPEPAIANFAQWANAYLSSAASDRPNMEDQGVQLATARRDFLKAEISKDPRRVLADSIPLAVRQQMPDAVEGLLEDRVNGYGDLYSLHTTPGMDGEGGASVIDYARVEGQSYEAFRYGKRTNTPYVNGASLHGVAIDKQLAVLDSPLRSLEPGEKIQGSTVNEYCPVSEETVAKPTAATVAAEEKTVFQIGTDLYGTCEPAHVTNVESAIVAGEQNAENTQKKLTNHDLQAIYKKSIAGGSQIYASGDSGITGSSGYIGKPPTSLTHGGKNILVMRVQPTDKPFPSWATVASFQDTVTRSDGWDVRMRRISYQKTWINRADITPVMTLPQNSAYYTGNGYDWGRWADDSKAAAAAQGYNLADYSCFVIAHEGYSQFGAAGWGGGGNIWCNGNFDVRLFVHEYGHVFWLPHANSWYSTDGNPISPSRQHREYGDANDPMGNAWGANQYNSFNAYFKNFCGWLPDSAVQTVTRSGTYRIYQDDGATALNRTLAIKFGRDYEFNYWISVRGDAIAQPNYNNGAAVMAVSSWRASDSKVLDLNNPGDDNRDNAPLAVNQTWYDAAADLTLKTIAVGGSNPNRYADVQVTFGPRNQGGYRPLVSGGVYRFKNRQNGKYLDVPGNSSADNVSVQVATASGTASQNWVAWRNADGTYSFNHQGTNKWLDVVSNGGGDGVDVIQYTGNGSDAQKWWVAQNPDAHLFLVHKGTDSKVLDMDPSGVNDLHQWGHNDGNWQQWYPELVGITPGTYRLLPKHAHYECLDIAGVSAADGAQAHLWEYVSGANQKWEVSNPVGSWLRLTPTHAVSKALDVNAAGSANGTKIQQWAWFNNNAQHWGISRTDGNWLRFTPECASGSCLEVTGDDDQFGNGSIVQLWQFTGAQDQQWRFADAD